MRGRTAALFAGVVFLSVRSGWRLRRFAWFWITVGVLVVFHVFLLFLVPWPGGRLAWPALMPVFLLDYGIVYGCIKLVEKLMNRSEEASIPN